jgi:hypothetical protein
VTDKKNCPFCGLALEKCSVHALRVSATKHMRSPYFGLIPRCADCGDVAFWALAPERAAAELLHDELLCDLCAVEFLESERLEDERWEIWLKVQQGRS